MRIIQVTAEFAPIAKAGGLGEALLGLSRELTLQHHQVDIILPKYAFLDLSELSELSIESSTLSIPYQGRSSPFTVWSARFQECQLHLIEPKEETLFSRDRIYGYDDDALRFLYFSRAALEYLASRNTDIDLLHLHDWHTAFSAPLFKDHYASRLRVKKVFFTIHNLQYQGNCGVHDLNAIGVDGSYYLAPNRLQDNDPHHPQSINLMKGGILYADVITAVSPSYAKEIQQKATGLGLSRILKQAKVKGVLNGIDPIAWNPETDPHLAANYSPSDPLSKIRAAKRKNKERLKKEYGIDCLERPLVGVISRLTPQKGLYLMESAIDIVSEMDGAFALIGSSPNADIQQQFNAIRDQHQSDPRIFLDYTYKDPLAHLLYAACDFLLVPSLFEPCGLTQIIAMRYGTIPIVRATGGLKDTVFDCENGAIPLKKRNGFVFHEPTTEELSRTLHRALSFWHAEQPTCLAMMRRMMELDWSWQKPAQEYLKLYTKQILAKPLPKIDPIAVNQ